MANRSLVHLEWEPGSDQVSPYPPRGMEVSLSPADSQFGHARLGLGDEEHQTAEVDGELQQHRQDRVHVEDVGQRPLGGEHLQRLPQERLSGH